VVGFDFDIAVIGRLLAFESCITGLGIVEVFAPPVGIGIADEVVLIPPCSSFNVLLILLSNDDFVSFPLLADSSGNGRRLALMRQFGQIFLMRMWMIFSRIKQSTYLMDPFTTFITTNPWFRKQFIIFSFHKL